MAAPKGNKNALGNEGGRPPIISSPEELQKKVDQYFIHINGERAPAEEGEQGEWIRHPEPATVTGLALFLGFSSRSSLYEYEAEVEYSDIIKKAKTKVEYEYEKRLYGNNVTGAIFALKNMGWKDKTETEHSGSVGVRDVTGIEVL